MAVLVGIDEAGYGPLLGPLIISSSSFSMPNELLNADLWQILNRSVSIGRKHLCGRLLIVDSKKAYTKSIGIEHLQRTVLTTLKCLGKEPETLAALLDTLAPDRVESLDDYPWYKDAGGVTLTGDSADRSVASAMLTNDLADKGIKLLDIQSCCLDVAYYNKMVKAVKNKASVLFTSTAQLIKKAYETTTDEVVQIVIDRQGGRMHYRPGLQLMFPEMELRILQEDQQVSSYELKANNRLMQIYFTVGADNKYLPVSLASMVCKYLRELLVGCINNYFTSFCADLKPTAGYWEDGLRFVEQLKKEIPHIKFDSEQLIRCK
jgi:ribonuclease HII